MSTGHLADRAWFDAHPDRRYRVRDGKAIRLVSGVFLRTPAEGSADTEAEAKWWRAAWPALPPSVRDKLKHKARRSSR